MTRIVKYDVLRVVACFSIVLLHVSASYWSVVDVHSKEFLVMTIYNSVTRFAVPVFFMLSGLFLVSPHRENTGLGKRILKLVMLFYVWSAFYAFQGVAVDALQGEFTMEVWKTSVTRFINGHIHMWFIQMLIGFYILIPVAKIAIFTLFKYCKVFACAGRADMWGKLSGYTFFVYLFHMFVIEKLNLIGITTVSFPAVISVPVLTLVTFGVSLLGAFVADHIPVIKKIVMLH